MEIVHCGSQYVSIGGKHNITSYFMMLLSKWRVLIVPGDWSESKRFLVMVLTTVVTVKEYCPIMKHQLYC